MFSFSQKLFASVERRLDRLYDVPRRSLAILLNQEWIFPLNLGDPLSRERGLERKTSELNVPSSSKLLEPQCIGLQPCSLNRPKVTSLPEPAPNLLDFCDSNGAQLALTWQFQAPKYQGDFPVHIWQEYRDPPKFEYADIFLLSSQRVIISFKSSRLLQRFASLRLDQSILGSDMNSLHQWSPTSEVLLSILTVYRQMIEDIGVFIQGSMQAINAMVRPAHQANTTPVSLSRLY